MPAAVLTLGSAGDARQGGSQATALLSAGGSGGEAPGGLRLSQDRTSSRAVDGLCGDLPVSRIRARGPNGEAMPMRCKRWGCPECGPWLKRRLRKAIAAAAQEHDLRRFFTLTLPSEWHPTTTRGGERRPNPAWNGRPVKDAYAELSAAWHRFQKKVARYNGGRKLAYGLVREPHKDGTPHFHGLVDQYLPFEKLAKLWAASGGGYADIRMVDTQRVAAYLSKYLSKDGNPPPKGCRKYATGGGVRFEHVRPRPSARGTWNVEVKLDAPLGTLDWVPVYDPGTYIGLLQRGVDVKRPKLRVVPTPPAPSCQACGGKPARDCPPCGGVHCRSCGGGSSRCWVYSKALGADIR